VIGEELASEGIITNEDLYKFKKMIGFRNIVVHGYLEIDVTRLRKILEEV